MVINICGGGGFDIVIGLCDIINWFCFVEVIFGFEIVYEFSLILWRVLRVW